MLPLLYLSLASAWTELLSLSESAPRAAASPACEAGSALAAANAAHSLPVPADFWKVELQFEPADCAARKCTLLSFSAVNAGSGATARAARLSLRPLAARRPRSRHRHAPPV